jgi:hypothetical protein
MEERSAINPNAEVNAAANAIAGAVRFYSLLVFQYALNGEADILIPRRHLLKRGIFQNRNLIVTSPAQ